jgi:hypothetical protein
LKYGHPNTGNIKKLEELVSGIQAILEATFVFTIPKPDN